MKGTVYLGFQTISATTFAQQLASLKSTISSVTISGWRLYILVFSINITRKGVYLHFQIIYLSKLLVFTNRLQNFSRKFCTVVNISISLGILNLHHLFAYFSQRLSDAFTTKYKFFCRDIPCILYRYSIKRFSNLNLWQCDGLRSEIFYSLEVRSEFTQTFPVQFPVRFAIKCKWHTMKWNFSLWNYITFDNSDQTFWIIFIIEPWRGHCTWAMFLI